MKNQATALLGLLTESSLHAGAGSSVSGVDLPIQREGHNGWPCVFGSAVKGALRDKAEEVYGKDQDRDEVLVTFGPETKNADANAGAIAAGDARLLLLPVRSLTGTFKWVTCSGALERLKRDAKRMDLGNDFSFDPPKPDLKDDEAIVSEGTGYLFLEEYRFTLIEKKGELEKCATDLAKLMERTEAEDELKKRLVIVSDTMFTHLTQAAVPVNAHIALNSDTKTTQDGALWYEETLPPETLLYVPLLANNSRKAKKDEQDKALDAKGIRKCVLDLFTGDNKPYLQLGGNETVGMGWCAVEIVEAKGA